MSDQTRRSWVVTISQAAVGLGLSGRVQAVAPADYQLPPGVYLPSLDHLGHALMSAEQFRPLALGCPTDYILPRSRPFTPLFFSASEFTTIRRLTELLLGNVPVGSERSPDSVSQEVAEWVDLRVSSADGIREAASRILPLHRALAVAYEGSARVEERETADPAKICREGLNWIDGAATEHHSNAFLSLEAVKQISILNTISDERAYKSAENPGTRFFEFLKREIITGLYTSRAGLKELDFKGNAFYARSPGCNSR